MLLLGQLDIQMGKSEVTSYLILYIEIQVS